MDAPAISDRYFEDAVIAADPQYLPCAIQQCRAARAMRQMMLDFLAKLGRDLAGEVIG
jgi:hypothetical protein